MGGIEDIILKWMTNSTIKIQYLNSFFTIQIESVIGEDGSSPIFDSIDYWHVFKQKEQIQFNPNPISKIIGI